MSTSLAVQPAFRTTKTERSKAEPDRTIFGTTLDNYGRCWKLLNDSKAIQEASDLYTSKLKWKKRSPTPQRMVDRAWGLRDFKQPEIGEEFAREYHNISDQDSLYELCDVVDKTSPEKESLYDIASRSSSRISFAKTAENRTCKSAITNRNLVRSPFYRATSAQSYIPSIGTKDIKHRPMSQPKNGKRSQGGTSRVQVPKFRLPPGATNFMKVASLKITETGAKDLLNSEPINKVGLGDTLQYDYQAFQRRETPQFYKDNGHVLLLGQRFTSDTTNGHETAPGGFYKLGTPQREFNERFHYVQDRRNEVTMTHQKPKERLGRLVQRSDTTAEEEFDITEEEIPLNIRHKFGEENVCQVLKENKAELIEALKKPTELRHAALVPARVDVKELNHPIDPPPKYFTNYGENLKYDKFEGGLHLYIK